MGDRLTNAAPTMVCFDKLSMAESLSCHHPLQALQTPCYPRTMITNSALSPRHAPASRLPCHSIDENRGKYPRTDWIFCDLSVFQSNNQEPVTGHAWGTLRDRGGPRSARGRPALRRSGGR